MDLCSSSLLRTSWSLANTVDLDILLRGCFWILFLYLAFLTLAGHWVFLLTARCVCFQGWQGQAWWRQLLFVIKHLRPLCVRFLLSPMSTMLGRIFRSHRHCSVLGGGCHTCCKPLPSSLKKQISYSCLFLMLGAVIPQPWLLQYCLDVTDSLICSP